MTTSEAAPEDKHSTGRGLTPKRPFRLLVKRLCLFFLVMYFITLSLWVTGNFRSFLDSTQGLLLGSLAWDSILLAVFSAIGFATVLVLPIPGRRRRDLLGLAGYALLIALGAVGALFGDSILTLAAGIH